MDRPETLTGQVRADGGENPVWPQCREHKEVPHAVAPVDDRVGQRRWCNRCGWNRERNVRLGNPNGGWGTP